MDALKVYDVKKICDARLYIVDMAAAYVRALATVLMMGGVAVLYRYRAVLVTLFCTRGRRPARSPSAPRAFGSARRLEARPGPAAAHGHRSPRVPQPGPAGLAVLSMLVVQTPFGGGEIAVRGGVMPKVQTTSAKNAENGLLWARWSAF